MRTTLVACWAMIICPSIGVTETSHQPYAGLQTREIATLSADDIQDLEEGRGWGLALAAELNGYPGPLHVLELADDLNLLPRQRQQIETLFGEMREEAIAEGAALIPAEHALNQAFARGDIQRSALSDLVQAAEAARARLRFTHLSRHLQTVGILSDHQVALYSVLRGYTSDPCLSVPQGHDAAMWRRHNGCEPKADHDGG